MNENKPVKAMKFMNYAVNNLEYHKNPKLDFEAISESDNKFNVPNNFSSIIYFSDDKNKENSLINIKVKIGNLKDADTPFMLKLDITAAFSFEFNDGKFSREQFADDIKNMLALSGNAIMFPYVRSLIADTTLRSNTFPSYIFPTINFVEMLKKGNNIKFVNVNSKDE